jgi:hypothetical protein
MCLINAGNSGLPVSMPAKIMSGLGRGQALSGDPRNTTR